MLENVYFSYGNNHFEVRFSLCPFFHRVSLELCWIQSFVIRHYVPTDWSLGVSAPHNSHSGTHTGVGAVEGRRGR